MQSDLGNIEKGYFGSLIVEAKLIKNKFNIFKPIMENGKVDMIIEKDNIYLKLQIKTIQNNRGSKNIPVRKISHNMGDYKITRYSEEEINYFVGVDLETGDVYMIPSKVSSSYASSIAISKVQQYKNNFNLMELNTRNGINGEDNIGEPLTCNDDGNTEGTE